MTAYFTDFPQIMYDTRLVKNITVRLDFLTRIKNNVSLFQHYNLTDGERPEDVSLKFYGDSQIYWIILYINDIIDPFYDWLLTGERLYDYVSSKYGAENINAVHHYETTASSDLGAGVWVSLGEPFSTAVSNLSYESDINEEKRTIKILNNRYVQQVLAEYSRELKTKEDL